MRYLKMKKYYLFLFFLLGIFSINIFGQFGKNKVQYKTFSWYYIQTDHFDIYFTEDGSTLAEFTAYAAEDALKSIQGSFKYKINNRITIIVYNSQNDFQETNVIDEYLSEGIQGFTELFKNRVVIQFTGSYKLLRHLIHHELVHAVINDMFYGGSLQNIISSGISVRLPLWFNEGMAEYQALGWDVDTDMFIRDAAINEYLPDINRLGGYFAYRGGQSVFYYIANKYGEEKIGELINKIKSTGSVEEGIKASIGISIKELNERWKKEIKQIYWPDIAIRKDPDEFSKRMTDHREDGGFYNTSPAISPQGDKIAFISNRDHFFDVFLMDAIDGKIIKKLVRGNQTPDFEELNILTPGLSWSPDGERIALSAKSGGNDLIYLINVQDENRKTLSVRLDGIKSVTWSPLGNKLAFIGQTSKQSDVYVFNLETNELINLTDDIFSNDFPAWSPDGQTIYFSSDRQGFLDASEIPDTFKIYKHDYNQRDIYAINVASRKVERITDLPLSDETSPVVNPDGSEILFISDINGINNIYKKKIKTDQEGIDVTEIPIKPVTNSLNGLYQLSLSKDGKKLTFSTLYQAAFNIFLMNNPFEEEVGKDELEPTVYVSKILKQEEEADEITEAEPDTVISKTEKSAFEIYTGSYIDTSKIYGDSVQIDFDNYVFGNFDLAPDTSKKENPNFNLTDNLDSKGDYVVNRYKITFSPDLIYANAGYSSLYGLLGTTIIAFSDVLGNHRLIGLTSLQIDLKNSDYGMAYYYLPQRVNYGIEAFHTARFVFLSRGLGANLFRFRNFGAVGSVSYPLNRFYRIDGGLSWLNVSSENLDNPLEESDKVSYLIPSGSFVHDNVLWGNTAPVQGTRYRFDVYGNPGISGKNLSFYTLHGDYRTYLLLGLDYSIVFRTASGYSGGANPQRFFIGGIDNWINRSFATTDVPLESASDFAFLTAALPLRGFDYAERIGSKYALMNFEFRFPLIRYLLTGALPILFSNIYGVAFFDAGSAWNNTKDLRFFERNEFNNIVTRDLLMGTGLGARMFFLYFLLRFDVAWAYDVDGFSKPKYYISLGADF
jgi:Tol biopolymer transport system component